MPRISIPVTHMRRAEAVAYLDGLARGLAQTLGPTCETLVQEITDGSLCTVLSIYNGHVSGRQAGSTLSIYGDDTSKDTGNLLEVLSGDEAVCMEARTPSGRRIKSSSWVLRGKGYVLLFGVNLDVTSLSAAEEVLSGLASVSGDLRESLHGASTTARDADSLIDECLGVLGRPAEILTLSERRELVRLLSERGFFDYQKSAVTLAERLGVSKNTIYNDLREL